MFHFRYFVTFMLHFINLLHIKIIFFYIKFSLTEIILEVGEDRLMVEARKPGYLFDGFLPHNVLQNESNAEFDNENKVNSQIMFKKTDLN